MRAAESTTKTTDSEKIIAFPEAVFWTSALPGAEAHHSLALAQETELQAFETALVDATDRERRLIGQELRDYLCQHLLGMAFSAQALAGTLAREGSEHAAEAHELAVQISESAAQVQKISIGLNPIETDSEGLMAAIQALALRTRQSLPCRFICDAVVHLHDPGAAAHCFHIVQEAVAQALRQTGASEITITLAESKESVCVEVSDNGMKEGELTACPQGAAAENLFYRAQAMHGDLHMIYEAGKGTTIRCTFPHYHE